MTREEIENKVKHIIYEQLCVPSENIKSDTVINYTVEDNNIYSTFHDFISIMEAIEIQFGIIISDSDLVNLRTFSDIINYIVKAQDENK